MQRGSSTAEPTELAITLATLSAGSDWAYMEGWVPADLVNGHLRKLGFDRTTQQTAATLARMARTDAPWVERQRDRWDSQWEYRITRYGKTDLDNQLHLRVSVPWLPVMRGVA